MYDCMRTGRVREGVKERYWWAWRNFVDLAVEKSLEVDVVVSGKRMGFVVGHWA